MFFIHLKKDKEKWLILEMLFYFAALY